MLNVFGASHARINASKDASGSLAYEVRLLIVGLLLFINQIDWGVADF